MEFKMEDSTFEKMSSKFEDVVRRMLLENRSIDLIQRDIFLSMIVYIIIEDGFTSVNYNILGTKCVNPVNNIEEIINWEQPSGIYEIPLLMNGFSEINIKLIMLPVGSTILLDVIINKNNSEVYTVCLPINKYVTVTESSTIPIMFKDFEHLSCTLKNKITSPVKSSILTYYGYSSASLIGLPEELIFNILFYLPVIDIVNTAKSCKRFFSLFKNESFWRKLFKRDFKQVEINDKRKDWKILYKETYLVTQNSSRSKQTGTLHDLMDLSDYVSYVDNPLWYLWDDIN